MKNALTLISTFTLIGTITLTEVASSAIYPLEIAYPRAADSAPATVMVTVNPVNDAPVADAQSVGVVINEAKDITLTGSDVDGDALTFAVVDPPLHGTLSGTAPDLTYTPDTDYTGADSFTFKVNDGTG